MQQLLAQIDFKIADQAADVAGQGLPGAASVLSSSDAGFGVWLGGIMSAVMLIAGLLLLLYLIWGGIDWITSGGDSGKVASARSKIMQAVIGMIVLAASTAILIIVQNFLGVNFVNFGGSGSSGGSNSAIMKNLKPSNATSGTCAAQLPTASACFGNQIGDPCTDFSSHVCRARTQDTRNNNIYCACEPR